MRRPSGRRARRGGDSRLAAAQVAAAIVAWRASRRANARANQSLVAAPGTVSGLAASRASRPGSGGRTKNQAREGAGRFAPDGPLRARVAGGGWRVAGGGWRGKPAPRNIRVALLLMKTTEVFDVELMNPKQMKKWLEQQGATFQHGKVSHLKVVLNGGPSTLPMHGAA